MNYVSYVLILAAFIPLVGQSQFYNTEVAASIDLEVRDNSILQITGLAENKTAIEKSLRYELSVIKSNKEADQNGNTGSTGQKGRAVLAAGDKKNLSSIAINIDDGDRAIMLLLIYDEEDNLVGKDRKVLNGIEGETDGVSLDTQPKQLTKEPDMKEEGGDGFILKGMVMEHTKTKAGNDFYDFYYGRYLAKKIDGEEVVTITEKLAIGSNTQIEVTAGDDVIMEFIVNPRSQYIEAMADRAIFRTLTYFQKKRRAKDQIIRY